MKPEFSFYYGEKQYVLSGWGGAFYNAIFQTMDDRDFAWAKKITEEYRKIRNYFSKDFYNHGSGSADSTAWAIWQYHDPEAHRGIVMAFRRCDSPFGQVTVDLKGLGAEKVYAYQSLDTGERTEGEPLLTICLPEKRSSTIVEYFAK